ncbi:chalcone isomerase family protein [Ferrimonas lipolytica]|uniref:Chalcone isomerase domain-containing protein n=1 Tax=Ferrimonas lipolytica TaxID=2724191 RepID=A0A6H1UAR1_9GAMM|nr:chalcone isomerase family protein [Ferrimonas lipolytica]QIZ75680.1 hypothetical protein HER31_01435 [Ferrimonas lipolytica]
MWALLAVSLLLGELKAVGQTELSVLWFPVYRATLYSDDGHYGGIEPPLLLQLEYRRDISRQALLEHTKQEWLKLGIDKRFDVQPWIEQLQLLWPQISKGDQLVFHFGETQSSFYYNQRQLGHIDDANFGAAFAAIWLDEGASYPRHRLELIGAK